jgi:hypothetical protein
VLSKESKFGPFSNIGHHKIRGRLT